jgi:hypothetical protein
MTREKLLEHGIYVPETVDKSIIANLLMGNSVLCEYYDPILRQNAPICLTPSSTIEENTPIKYRFKILKDFGNKQIQVCDSMMGTLVWVDNNYSNYFLQNSQAKNILEYF